MDASGNLLGITHEQGQFGFGTAFEVAAGSDAITTLASFNSAVSSNPVANPIFDSAGNLYVTTVNQGNAAGAGSVSELANGSNTITTVSVFHAPAGEDPFGGVSIDSAGNLYGTTFQGFNGSG